MNKNYDKYRPIVGHKDKKVNAILRKTTVLKDEGDTRLKEQSSYFNTEDHGYIQTEEDNDRERTLKVKQKDLQGMLGEQNAQSVFDLNLKDFGPYKSMDFTSNGKHVLMGSRKGHVAMLNWKEKELVCEFQTKQLIRDVHFLQDENMFAVAQKKYLYMYDSQGIELHQMRDVNEPSLLEFLPYHFLLCAATKLGFLKYLDITNGKEIAECKTRKGEATCMQANQQNGIICTGHTNGDVAMWSPNMASKPVVKMLAHLSSPVTSLAISKDGRYMTTTGKDARFKVWDIRNSYKCLYDYFTPTPATASAFSDTGLISLSFGNEVQIWKNTIHQKQKAPYMKHKFSGADKQSGIHKVQFVPYQDVMGIVHDNGYASILVPGAGQANFDAYEANPFESVTQRKEKLVHGLMEKLDPATISVKIDTIGHIDDAAPEVIAKEQREEQDRQIEEMRKKEKKIAKKMRGRSSTGNKQTASARQQHEKIRDNNKLAYLKENDRAKAEAKQIDQDVEFLTKHETKFDPISEMFDKQGNLKRQRKESD